MSTTFVIHRRGVEPAVIVGDTETRVAVEIFAGQFEDVEGIDAYDIGEGWARDISEDVAIKVSRMVAASMEAPRREIRDFIEEFCGVGAVLTAAA